MMVSFNFFFRFIAQINSNNILSLISRKEAQENEQNWIAFENINHIHMICKINCSNYSLEIDNLKLF